MPTYTYVVRDPVTENRLNGEIQADTESNAARILIDKGLAPIEITQKQEGQKSNFGHKVPAKARVIFSRQLATLINSGLPLMQSLTTVGGQTANAPLKEIIANVVNDVEAGSSFSEALAKYPKVFDNVYISLVAAGEASGSLDVSLERLANQQEKDAEIMSRVKGAMMYPVIVLLVLFGVLAFMMIKVLPQVQSLYSQLPGAKLPLMTRALLSGSHFATHFWWIMLSGLAALVIFGRRWSKTANGISTLDRLKMKLPALGPMFMKLYMARFARTGSTLVASGVPMLKMLATSAQAVGNVHIEASLSRAAEEVKGGRALSEAMRGDPNFLDLVPNMINVGEQSGTLDTMLSKVADYYEKEVDEQVKSISTIIEPVMMVVVGIIALVIVAAVLLPIYSLAGQNIGGGL